MSDEGCANCAALRARVSQLEHENAQLRAYIGYLLAVLDRIARYVRGVIQEGDRVLSGHQPRGTWSFWTGCKQVAERVHQLTQR